MSLSAHNIRYLYWAQFMGGMNFMEPIIVLFYLHHGLTPTEIFITLLCFSGSVLLFEIPTGAFADRFGAKAAFMVGAIFRLLSITCLLFAQDPWLIYLSQILSGCAESFFSGADEALVYESLKEDDRTSEMGKVIGKLESASMIPMIFGLILGAWLAKDLTQTQFSILLFIQLFFIGIQMIFLSQLRMPSVVSAFREQSWHHVRQGWREIKQSPRLLLLFANFTIIFITTYVYTTFEQPSWQQLQIPVESFGLILAGGYLLSTIASNMVGWLIKIRSEETWMWISGIAIILGYVVFVWFDQSVIVAIFVALLIRVARTIRWPMYAHLRNQYISSGSRATTLSLLSVLDSVFDLLLVLSLASIAHWGIPSILVGCISFAVLALLFPVKGRDITKLSSEQIKQIK